MFKQNLKYGVNFESNLNYSEFDDLKRLPHNLKGDYINFLSSDDDYKAKYSTIKQLPYGDIQEENIRKASIANNFDFDIEVEDEYNTLRPREINLLSMKRKSSIKSIDTSSSKRRFDSHYINDGNNIENRSYKSNNSLNFGMSEKSFCNYDFFENLNKNFSTYSMNNENNVKKTEENKLEKSVDDNWSLSLTDNN